MPNRIVEEEARRLLYVKHGEAISLLEFYYMDKEARFKCSLCEKEWVVNAYSVIRTGHGCPRCSRNNQKQYNKKSHDEIEKIVNDLEYILLDKYIKNYKQQVIIQDKIGYKYNLSLYDLINSKRQCFVRKNNPYSLENISLWLYINKPDYELCKNSQYRGNKKHLLFYHKECGETFHMSWDAIFSQNQDCSICSGRQVGKYNSLAYLKADLAEEWNYGKNKLTPEEVTISSGKRIYWICRNCGYGENGEWFVRVADRAKGKGCPRCSSSEGEKSINKILQKLNIVFLFQHRFKKCRNIRSLPFDFYLSNLKTCVEYHGVQHYESVDFFGGEKRFKIQQKLDKIKEKYCNDNKIKLLIIPYWEFNNISSILKTNLL